MTILLVLVTLAGLVLGAGALLRTLRGAHARLGALEAAGASEPLAAAELAELERRLERRARLVYLVPLAFFLAQLAVAFTLREHGPAELSERIRGARELLALTPVLVLLLCLGAWSRLAVRLQRARAGRPARRGTRGLALRLWLAFFVLPVAGAVLALHLVHAAATPWAVLLVLGLALPAGRVVEALLLGRLLPTRGLEDPALAAHVAELARAAGLPSRAVRVVDAEREGLARAGEWAFASGLLGRARAVVLSAQLAERCPREEALAVIAHELAHLRLGHLAKRALAVLLLYAAALAVHALVDRHAPELARPAAALALLGPGLLLLRAYERRTELDADRLAAEWTSPTALAAALERLAPRAPRRGPRLFLRAWSTHPPVAERVRRLRGAPGRSRSRGGGTGS